MSIKDDMEVEMRGTCVKETLEYFMNRCDDYADVIVIARTPEDTVYTAHSADSYVQALGMLEYAKHAIWDDQQEDYADDFDY